MQKTYHKQTAKFIATVVQNIPEMPSDIMQGWIEDPRGLSKVLAEALCSSEEDVFEFPVFKTIELGTHNSINELRQSIKGGGFRISDRAEDSLNKITLAKTKTEVMLHVATVRQLTGKDRATNCEINDAIHAKGYYLCPAEVGPQLLLQYWEPFFEGCFRLAMEPIVNSNGDLSIFRVGVRGNYSSFLNRFFGENNYCRCWIEVHHGHPDYRWPGEYPFLLTSGK